MKMKRLTRVMMELLQLLLRADVDMQDLEERVNVLKYELGSWFMDGYPLYQGS